MNKYSKKRLRKHYFSKEEFEGIQKMLISHDYESQILGLSMLRESKTIKHYRKCQRFYRLDLTNDFYQDRGQYVYEDIDLILALIIDTLRKFQNSIHELQRSTLITVDGYKFSCLIKELGLWLDAHRIK